MGEHEAALDTHVVIDIQRWDDLEEIKLAIKTRLENEFGIRHSTLEFERSDRLHQDAEKYGHG
jgi:cobalt-zinc-cadmium efflux system protein